MKKIILSILTVFSIATFGQSTYTDYPGKWRIGLNAGAMWQSSDVTPHAGIAGGFTIEKILNKRADARIGFSLGLRYLSGNCSGLDTKASYGVVNNNALNGTYDSTINYAKKGGYFYNNYKSYIHEGALELKINFPHFEQKTNLIFHIMGGIGICNYKTWINALDANGNMYDFSSLQNMQSVSSADVKRILTGNNSVLAQGSSPNGTTLFVPSIGVGFGFKLSRHVALVFEYRASFPATNLLDGVAYNNNNEPVKQNDFYNYASANLLFTIYGRHNTGSYVPPPANTTGNYTPANQAPLNNNYAGQPVYNNTTPPSNPVYNNYQQPVYGQPLQAYPPYVNISYPQNNFSSQGNYITVQGNIQNIQTFQQISISQNGYPVKYFTYDPYSGNIHFQTFLQQGTNNIIITANSLAGTGSQGVTVFYNPPYIPNNGNGSYPYNGGNYTNTTNTYNGGNYNGNTGNYTNTTNTGNTNGGNYSNTTNSANGGNYTNTTNPVNTGNNGLGNYNNTTHPINPGNNNGGTYNNTTNTNVTTTEPHTGNIQNNDPLQNVGGHMPVNPGTVNEPHTGNIQNTDPLQNVGNHMPVNPGTVNEPHTGNIQNNDPLQTVGGHVPVNPGTLNEPHTGNIQNNDPLQNVGGHVPVNPGTLNEPHTGNITSNTTIQNLGNHAPVLLEVKPVVQYLNPMSSPEDVTVGTANISASVQNISLSNQITVSVNGSNIQQFNYNPSNKEVNFTASLLTGYNSINVSATNSAGSDSKSTVIDYKPVGKPPRIDIFNPSTSPYTSQQSNFIVSGYVYNVSSSSDIVVQYNGSSITFNYNNSTHEIEVPLNLSANTNQLTITATNTFGNDVKQLSLLYPNQTVVNSTLSGDQHTLPKITVMSPSSNPYTSMSGAISIAATIGSVTNASNVSVTYNGAEVSFSYNPGISQQLNITSPLKPGNNTFIINASNSIGSASKSIDINYVPTNPNSNVNGNPSLHFEGGTNNASNTPRGTFANNTQFNQPAQPARPVQNNTFTQPAQPARPAQNTQPAQPNRPAQPINNAKPAIRPR